MPVRLVGLASHVLHWDIRAGVSRVRGVAVVAIGAFNTLVGVGGLLGGDTPTPLVAAVRGAARAAARAEQPEHGRTQREGDGQPCRGVHVAAHVAVDLVGLQSVVEGAGEHGVEGGSRD